MKYKWKKRPYRHQVEAVKQAIRELGKSGGFALLMEPRTGKTKTAVDIMSILHKMGKVNRVVVICPINALEVWVNELQANCPYELRILVWDRHGRQKYELPRWGKDVLDVVIINYDAFATTGIKKGKVVTGKYAVRDAVRRWSPQLVLLDESHRIKTASAARSRMIVSLAWQERRPRGKPSYLECLVPYRLILTGTVLTKKKRIFDIYSQWKFLDPYSKLVRGHTLASFKDEYSQWTERNGYPQWLRNKAGAEDRLRKLMHRQAFAVTRDECYDLPDRLPPQIIHVPLEASGKYYDEMAEEMIIQLRTGEITWAKIPLVQRLRLAQITGGILKTEATDAYPNGRLIRVGDEKLRYLREILVDIKDQDEKTIIGARFRGDITSIRKLCVSLKIPVFEIHGGIDAKRHGGRPSERDRMIRGFTDQVGPAVFIGQPAAASEAIDLRVAGTTIWYSLVPSWVQFTQFEDRNALNPRGTRYIYLLGQNTVDELQYESLIEDGDMAKLVTASPDRLLRNFKP